MKIIQNIGVVFLITLILFFSACTESEAPSLPFEDCLSVTALSKTEIDAYSSFIDDISFHTSYGGIVTYFDDYKSFDKATEVELNGTPVLFVKSFEAENSEWIPHAREDVGNILGFNLSFSAMAICRVGYSEYIAPSGNAMSPTLNTYNYYTYAGKELPKIADSDMAAEEKVSAYREYGIFAVPYVMEEIEAGNTELEPFFALIGTHLTTAEYMDMTETYNPVKYKDTPPPTKEEIDAMLIEGAKDFDYKKWYAENKTDIENLEKFLDAYCAEYEAETAS